MTSCLMYRNSRHAAPPRFYRVEISYNLFNEISVLREWGIRGGRGQMVINIFGNLRDASLAADRFRARALRRGYERA